MRLFTSVDDPCAHFFLYVTESAEVMRSPSYMKILDNPSPWTRKLMPKFGLFDRAAGEKIVKIGRGFGSHVLVSRARSADAAALDPRRARQALNGFINLPDAMGVRLLATDRGTTGIETEEKKMRSGREGDFDFLLVVEALSLEGAEWARDRLSATLPQALPGLTSYDHMVCRMIYGEAPYEGEAPL